MCYNMYVIAESPPLAPHLNGYDIDEETPLPGGERAWVRGDVSHAHFLLFPASPMPRTPIRLIPVRLVAWMAFSRICMLLFLFYQFMIRLTCRPAG